MGAITDCLFCKIISGDVQAVAVYEDDTTLAFLDHRPLFLGHTLVVPREHFETLSDLPSELIGPFFARVKLLAQAVEAGMSAEGTFVAMNNRISQSVPHLHAHVVPRRRKDGLKGFFWPRTKYSGEEEMSSVQDRIAFAVKEIRRGQHATE
jgi:histidine triad (HIT) family protein